MATANAYQAYYTKSDPILTYMTSILGMNPTDSILEPCGGDGVFVDKILEKNPQADITVYELNPFSASLLRQKYSTGNIKITEADTLLDNKIVNRQVRYDKIIGNPPYGARVDADTKDALNRIYPHLYTKESYTLFLYACIHCLKEGGELSFIIPDTFLSLHRHHFIRKFILTNTQIKELSLFPSSFFPGVNFGYANLCIITLKKNSDTNSNLANRFRIRTDFSSVNDLPLENSGKAKHVSQSEIYYNIGSAFMFNADSMVHELINSKSITRIADIADCVTGFYSGDDKNFLHPISKDIKNAKRYSVVNHQNIHEGSLSDNEQKNGIKGERHMIPIVKGGNIGFVKSDNWFMDWSEDAISKYRASSKCRFQNPRFYFRNGIAIPMIRSSRLTAALIDRRLFDQSIVGVFPRDEKYLYYLLGFFNTKLCTEIISAINPSTNNSANYIKKIPLVIPTYEELSEVDSVVISIVEALKQGEPVPEDKMELLEGLFTKIYSDSNKWRKCISPTTYKSDLIQLSLFPMP